MTKRKYKLNTKVLIGETAEVAPPLALPPRQPPPATAGFSPIARLLSSVLSIPTAIWQSSSHPFPVTMLNAFKIKFAWGLAKSA